MKEPLVSVVIPFFENAQWLDEALSSVRKQSYKVKEVLVINDGSEENIEFIKEKYGNNISVYDKKNGGPASARNLGIEMAKGKYIAFLDSDDKWHQNKLKIQVEFMEKNRCVWSQHSYEMFWDQTNKSRIVNTSMYLGDVYRDCYISFKVQTSSVMVLRSILINEDIKFPLNMRYGQDSAFYRMLAKNHKLGSIDSVLSNFRIRGKNAGFNSVIQLKDRADLWNEIKNNSEIQQILPQTVILGYKIAFLNNNIFDKTLSFTNFNKKFQKQIANILYFIPYIMFKKHSKK